MHYSVCSCGNWIKDSLIDCGNEPSDLRFSSISKKIQTKSVFLVEKWRKNSFFSDKKHTHSDTKRKKEFFSFFIVLFFVYFLVENLSENGLSGKPKNK